MNLDEKGICCGRKPIEYKGGSWNSPDRQKFCSRCFRSFVFETGDQRENWAWKKNDKGDFERVIEGRGK